MNIFEIIINPFIYIIEHIFMLSYGITSNYGGAIVLLSFIISLMLLPIFIYIEKAKKKDDIIKQKMKPLVDEIKHSYKGQERYYYIKTLNRQHNYSPTRALIPILSLLIQIPFFIAAYQFLESYSPLVKESFLFISDLSKADALFGSINMLPILMTLINLLTVYFYTINSNDKKERNQMIIVAAVFLIMLFNLPAGLLLYWTLNNAFSFLRLFITNPEVFARKRESKTIKSRNKFSLKKIKNKAIFYISFSILIIIQLNWAMRYNFDDFLGRVFLSLIISMLIYSIYFFIDKKSKYIVNKIHQIENRPKIYFSLLFFAIYFHLSSVLYYNTINNDISIIALLLVIPLEFIGIYIFIKSTIDRSKRPFISLLISLIFIFQFINISALISGGDLSINMLNISIDISKNIISGISGFGLLITLILTFYNKTNSKINIPKINKGYIIWGLSLLYIFGQIFLWGPLLSYASFPEAFEFMATDIIKSNLPVLIIIITALFIGFKFLGTKAKNIAIISTLGILIVAFVNSILFPIDLGSLQINKFSQEKNLASPILNYIIESAFIISTIFFIIWIFKKKYYNQIVISLILLNSVIIGQSLYSISKIYEHDSKKFIGRNIEGEKIINFSKTENNVIILMQDMFQGFAMENIINEKPDFINNFTGFKWYRNTLSVSMLTNSSVPALMGGFDYLPNILDKDTSHTIRHKMTSALKSIVNKAQERDFDITINKFAYTDMEEISYDILLPSWHKEWENYNQSLGINSINSNNMNLLVESALLYSCPLLAKATIYNKGNWTKSYFIEPKINENSWIAKKYNFLRLLPQISTTQNNKSNFILLSSLATHFPWNYVDNTGELHNDVSPIINNRWALETFSKWIQWMKDNDVYDNTMIIFVSDHGIPWSFYEGDVEIKLPIKNMDEKVVSMSTMINLNPVLLVKDYNQKGEIQIDDRLMSNVDMNSIIFDKVNVTNSPIDNNRKIKTFVTYWAKNIDKRTQFIYNTSYEVKGNVFDVNNWKKIKK